MAQPMSAPSTRATDVSARRLSNSTTRRGQDQRKSNVRPDGYGQRTEDRGGIGNRGDKQKTGEREPRHVV